jgi:hypothetical protein
MNPSYYSTTTFLTWSSQRNKYNPFAKRLKSNSFSLVSTVRDLQSRTAIEGFVILMQESPLAQVFHCSRFAISNRYRRICNPKARIPASLSLK